MHKSHDNEKIIAILKIKRRRNVPLVLCAGEETRLVRYTRWMENRLELATRGRN